MTARIRYGQKVYPLNEGESVLDGLLRGGEDIPRSCKAGICQSCVMKAVEGEVPDKARQGLRPGLVRSGMFLACQCHPTGDLTVADAGDAGLDMPARIVDISRLNHNVLKVVLRPERVMDCEPGQFVTLINGEGVARSYSIANDPTVDGTLLLHVRQIADGRMSGWLGERAVAGDAVILRGPAGNCFYAAGEGATNFPIFLAGTGTGLAPLYGIANRALSSGHAGPIHLFHGALTRDDLYLDEDLQRLDQTHDQFTYSPCVLDHGGDIKETVLSSLPAEKAALRLFLCGAPDMVNALKTEAFLAGLSSRNIMADPFVPSQG